MSDSYSRACAHSRHGTIVQRRERRAVEKRARCATTGRQLDRNAVRWHRERTAREHRAPCTELSATRRARRAPLPALRAVERRAQVHLADRAGGYGDVAFLRERRADRLEAQAGVLRCRPDDSSHESPCDVHGARRGHGCLRIQRMSCWARRWFTTAPTVSSTSLAGEPLSVRVRAVHTSLSSLIE